VKNRCISPLRAGFEDITRPNRTWLLGVYVVAPRPLLSLYGIIYVTWYTSHLPNHTGVRLQWLSNTRQALLGHERWGSFFNTYQNLTGRVPTFLIWNNLCDLVYQTPTKSYQSQIPVAFGIPGHVTTKRLPDTPCYVLVGVEKRTYGLQCQPRWS